MPDLGDIGLDDFQKTLKDVFSNEEDAKEVLDSCEKMMSMLTQGMQNTPMPPMQPPSQQQQQQQPGQPPKKGGTFLSQMMAGAAGSQPPAPSQAAPDSSNPFGASANAIFSDFEKAKE